MTIFAAPGRVNLIGEHTDHAGGLALPVAIDRSIRLEVLASSPSIELRSSGREPASMPADGSHGLDGWARFPAAVAAELASHGRPSVGIVGELSSDLPEGEGLSSSAALTVAIAMALCEVADFPIEPRELALICSRAEQRAVGVPCGVMDHLASLFGREDHAVLLNATSLEIETIPLPADLRMVVLQSGVSRELEHTSYELRRRELQRGLAGANDQAARRRAEHFQGENRRVMTVVDALRAFPPDLPRVGEMLLASHASLRDRFEVSTPELDVLVELAVSNGALGAKLTGAGFGGSVVALCSADETDAIGTAVILGYRNAYPELLGSYLVCEAADGALRLGRPRA